MENIFDSLKRRSIESAECRLVRFYSFLIALLIFGLGVFSLFDLSEFGMHSICRNSGTTNVSLFVPQVERTYRIYQLMCGKMHQIIHIISVGLLANCNVASSSLQFSLHGNAFIHTALRCSCSCSLSSSFSSIRLSSLIMRHCTHSHAWRKTKNHETEWSRTIDDINSMASQRRTWEGCDGKRQHTEHKATKTSISIIYKIDKPFDVLFKR